MNRKLLNIALMSLALFTTAIQAEGKGAKASVTGRVTAEGKGIAGVVVSDGYDIAVTDSKGCYKLPSNKENGYVFVSTPGGYSPPMDGNTPVFWKPLTESTDKTETVDFELKKVTDRKHAFIATSDKHLTRRNGDLEQYAVFVKDINATADSLRAAGYHVEGIDLGDLTWDQHWRSRDMGPAKVKKIEQAIDMPLYHLMGNHDNDPYFNSDREAEKTFEREFGPIYYSFNIGDAHYVVLDNIIYDSHGATPDTMGSRTFRVDFTKHVMDWFKKDLATVKDKSAPLIVSMHAPLFHVDRSLMPARYRLPDGEGFEECLKGFSNVRVLSGHSHVINNIPLKGGNGIEHNIPSICGTFWYTDALSGNHICRDGSPAGYLVILMDGDQIKRAYYKCYDFPADYQFRAYDMNTAYVDSTKIADPVALKKYSMGYMTPRTDNEVLINVFNYDPSWRIEVTENGKPLSVIRLASYDPLHALSYNCNQMATGKKPSKGGLTAITTHLFKVKAKSPTSTLDIKVTDGYGRVYRQLMERPKTFHEVMW